jgi:N-acetylneuraminate synthase
MLEMKIKIGNKNIGNGCPVFIIAEACDNHLGSLEMAKEMVKQAYIAGCDAVKFQHHLPDEEMLRDVPSSDNFNIPLYDFLIKYSLTIKQHEELKNYCEKTGLIYLCTPFSWKAAQELNEIGVEAFKIGSGEMTDIPTLERISGFKKPMIVSTGMCTFEEIDRTYYSLIKTGIPLAFTNCVSEYPPVYEDINLGVLPLMMKRYPDAVIGHSDHTPDLFTSFAAVVLGARIIEKHVIMAKQTPGPDQSVSIDFFDLHNLVNGIRKIEVSLGSDKSVHKKEEKIREWAFRSIVSTTKIKKGQVINGDMIWSKRPGTGIPSYKRSEIIGKKARKNIDKNVLIKWDDLQ